VCPVHGYLKGEHFSCPKCKVEKENEIMKKIAQLEKEREKVLVTAN
jgi:ribonucleoside-triphosphate reductase